MWALIISDAEHIISGTFYEDRKAVTPARLISLWLFAPEFRLALWYRVSYALYYRGHTYLARWVHFRTRRRYGSDIHYMATIGPGLRLVHGTDIVIGPLAVIGARATIFNGVTLGSALTRTRTDGMPSLGDDVVVGTGAKLLGSIRVGNGARIGANAVVLGDVGPNHIGIGIPARSIPSKS